MRINLLINGEPIEGFVNFDPVDGSNGKIQCHLGQLDEYIDDAEVVELRVNDILDFVSPQHIEKLLDYWLSKLAHSGEITISGVDAYEVAHRYTYGVIDRSTYISLLHGDHSNPYRVRHHNFTLSDIVDLLKSRGLMIVRKRLADMIYEVCARRL